MKKTSFYFRTLALGSVLFSSCVSDDDNNSTADIVDNRSENTQDQQTTTVRAVDSKLFLIQEGNVTIEEVPCTLSDGTKTTCYQIVANHKPSDHQMGPWCPRTISDGKEKGGIWLEGGEKYDVDGTFIQNMNAFYKDTTWKMYDPDGNIYVTDTQEDCGNAANPNVGDEYKNYCVECLPSYVEEITQTYLIPKTPVKTSSSTNFASGPRGGNAPSIRGLAFNGVHFDAPAPTSAILGAYTLAPFDDAGGHINLAVGYHYHAATGLTKEVNQEDSHAAMIGYALDGHGLYAHKDANGDIDNDLDNCRGHYDEQRGYHYHVDYAGENNFINCLHGAYAID